MSSEQENLFDKHTTIKENYSVSSESYLDDDEYQIILKNKCGSEFWKVCQLLSKGDYKTTETNIPEAAYNGNLERVKHFLKSGLQVDFRNEFGNTGLHLAVLNSHNEIAQELMKNGANTNSIGNLTHKNQTPLHAAALNGNNEGILLLLGNNALVNSSDLKGETPLHLAVREGYLSTVELFLKSGSDVRISNVIGQTCLFSAVYFNHTEIVELLLENGSDWNVTDILGNSLLHIASKPKHIFHLSSKKMLVNFRNRFGETPLLFAVKHAQYEKIEALIRLQADPNIPDFSNTKPLHRASASDLEMVEQLLEAGAKTEVQDDDGMTPLQYAAVGCQLDIISVLLKHGASVNSQSIQGYTPLSQICWNLSLEGTEPLEEVLSFGADPNIPDVSGKSPLFVAILIAPEDAVCVLLDAGSELCHTDNCGRSALAACVSRPEITSVLLKRDISTNVQDKKGMFALHHFVYGGDYESTKLLLDKDISLINATDRNGITALHYAALKGDSLIIDYLCTCGAKIDSRDDFGRTPIHYAAYDNNSEGIKCLEKRGSDICAEDLQAHTALDIAIRMRSKDVVLHLLKGDDLSIEERYPTFLNKFKSNCKMRFEIGEEVSCITKSDIEELSNISNQTVSDTSQIQKMLKTPSVGQVDFARREEKHIKETFAVMFKIISEEIERRDHRFKNSLVFTGSTAEHTKVGLPDEFDVMFVLHEFSALCAPPNESERENIIFVPIQATKDDMPHDFREFFGNNILLRKKLFHRFSHLVNLVMMSDEFVWPESLYPHQFWNNSTSDDKEVTCMSTFLWRGTNYIELKISVDMVPALHFTEWPSDIQSTLINDEIKSEGFHVVAKPFDRALQIHPFASNSPFSPHMNLWRISFTVAEQRIFQTMRETHREAYRLCKIVRSQEICPLVEFCYPPRNRIVYFDVSAIIPTYFLKMAFFNTLIHAKERTHLEDSESKDIAVAVYEYLENCIANSKFPMHFLPSYNLLQDVSGFRGGKAAEIGILVCRMLASILSS